VEELIIENNRVKGVLSKKENKIKRYNADAVIIATGGKSYPQTGSTGDGQKMAEKKGHKIIELKQSLVPLRIDKKINEKIKKTNKKFFNDPVVKYGYCRGEEPYNYVKDILNTYEHYKKFID